MRLKELFIRADNKVIEYWESKPHLVIKKYIRLFSINPKVTYLLFLYANFLVFQNKFLINIIFLLLADIFIWCLKRLIKRQRPEKYSSSMMHKVSGLGPDAYSFPSAHTFTAFQIIPVSFMIFGYFGLFFILYALLVASSRVVLKHHFFSDVFAGALLGLIFGLINISII